MSIHYDLVIIGTGSGNTILGPEFAGLKVAIVEKGVFGGTCLNVGCIPTKMFVHTAEVAATPSEAARYNLTETLDAVDWPAIRDRIFGRIDPIAAGGEEYRETHPDNANVTVHKGTARLTGPHSLVVEPLSGAGDQGAIELTTDRLVLAAGSRAVLPEIEGLGTVPFHTSDTIMRLEALPERLAILGSGYIAVEFANIFASLGVDVTVIARSGRVLRREDPEISQRATELLGRRVRLLTDTAITRAETGEGGVVLTDATAGGDVRVEADELLVATGRVSNADLLEAAAAGFDTHPDGRLVADDRQRAYAGGAPVPGVYALGDVCSPFQLKHVANWEARTVRANLLAELAGAEGSTESRHDVVPHAVFGHPQIASVGMSEDEARAWSAESGVEIAVAHQDYAGIAYGWAMEDETGFAKIIATAGGGRILGAHIIGPQAPTLIQVLIQAMSTGQTVADIAGTQYWIHPAMPELVENALLQLL